MKKEVDIYNIPRSRIIGEIRRQWFRSPHYKACLNRIVSDKVGVRGGARVDCVVCGVDIPKNKASVNHLEHVIPLDKNNRDLTLDEIAERMWCDIEDTEIMCKECHKKQSKKENLIRKKHRDERKRQDGKPK